MTKISRALLAVAAVLGAVVAQPAHAGKTAKAFKNGGLLVQMLEADVIAEMLNTSDSMSLGPLTTCGPMCASWTYSVRGLPLVLPQEGSNIGFAINRATSFVTRYAQAMAPYYFSPESRQFCAEPSSAYGPTIDEIPANNTPSDFTTAGCGTDATCQMIAAGGGIDYALFDNEAFASETCEQDTLDSGDCEICQESYTCDEYFGNSKYSGGDIVDAFVAPWFDTNASMSEANAGIASTMCVLETGPTKNWGKLKTAFRSVIEVLSNNGVTDMSYAYPEVTSYVPIDEKELKQAAHQLQNAAIAIIYRVPESPTNVDNEEYQTAYELTEAYNAAHAKSNQLEMFNCTGTFDDGDDFTSSLPLGCSKVL